ncbi:MAG: glycosyltransferase family 4 protein [Thioploca sp.]|nr:glycosyltransferase family 4 protein [Thioploca sp.]
MTVVRTLLILMKPVGLIYLLWEYKLAFLIKVREVIALTYRVITKRKGEILVAYTKNHPAYNLIAQNPPPGMVLVRLSSRLKPNFFLNFLATKIDICYEDAPTPVTLRTNQPIVKESECPYFNKAFLTDPQIKKIFVYSHWAKPDCPDPDAKMEVLHPAPILKKVKPKRESKRVTIFMSGAASARKGADILYQAFENVENKLASPYQLFLILASNYKSQEAFYPINSTCAERIQTLYKRSQTKKNVYWGRIYPPRFVDYIYDHSDIYVLPARFDTCPFSVFEAMASSLPIIVSGIQAFPELIHHGENGFLIDVNHYDDLQSQEYFEQAVKQLEEYLTTLITDTTLRLQMGEASRNRVEKKFNLAYRKNRLKEIFEEITTTNDLHTRN